MGKRKRAPSPKENSSEQQTLSNASLLKVKCAGEIKKTDSHASENSSSEKIDSQDRVNTYSSMDTEVCSDDRPTPQLRISARVQNKQRREESIKVDAQQNRQRREEGSKLDGQPSLISLKKIDASSQDEDDDDDDKVKDSAVVKKKRRLPHNGDAKKRRRPWLLWSMENKDFFFEAINECGKDFEAIQNFLLTKMRKKGVPTCMIKNRDQVRHFYYRTLHKISKFITLKEDVKKSTLELYTLINYGELRRKVGGTLNEKKALKLHELIQKGSASVRVRGKSIRVRTPVCRGLKKLNEFPDDRELGARVPVTITIEIVPANISSWNYVQSLAHNPRVRISCSMHKTVASIITHLENKWRNSKQKICDSLISSANFAVQMPNTSPKSLRLRPHNITSLNVVSVKPESQVKSCAISLSSHMQLLQRARETDLQRKRGGETIKGRDCRPTRKKKGSSFSKEKASEEMEMKDDNANKKEEDEPTGELSQEEPDEGSDIEIEEHKITSASLPISSPDESLAPGQDDVIVIESCGPTNKDLSNGKEIPPKPPPCRGNTTAPTCDLLKEESLTCVSPSYDEEVMSAVKNIKEEFTDSMETIHQLIALENVATSQEIEEDADVICIGESTRLSAQLHRKKKKNESSQNTSDGVHTASSSAASQEQDESPTDKTPPSAEAQNEQASGSVGDVETSSAYLNTRSIDRVKLGWTSKTCGIITVGELYLMFGENKQITLEYDFEEESENAEKVSPNTVTTSTCDEVKAEVEGNRLNEGGPKPTENTAGQDSASESCPGVTPLATPSSSSVCSSPLVTDGSLSQPSSQKGEPPPPVILSPLPRSISSPDRSGAVSPNPSSSSDVKDGDNFAAGGMVFSKDKKPATEDVSDIMAKLLCLIQLLSAPKGTEAGTPCVCGGNSLLPKNAVNPLRSPSSARSCFNGLFRSPGNSSKSPRGCSVSVRSPRTTTLPSTATAMSPGDTSNPGLKVEKTKPASAKRLITEAPEKSATPVPGIETTITSGKDKGPDGDKSTTVAVNPSDTNSDLSGGEFRLPVGPAPRNHACQSPNPSFNAQLSKLLRRYSRPTRRSVRKNMVVQRQLPLLPRLPKDSQGFVTLKIDNLQQFNIATANSQLSLPINVTLAPTASSANQANENVASTDVSQSTITSVIVPQAVTMPIVPEPLVKDIKVEDSNNVNAISVNVSGQQLLTVRMPPYPVSTNSITTTSANGQLSTSSTSQAALASALPTSSTYVAPTDISQPTIAPVILPQPITVPIVPQAVSMPIVPEPFVKDITKEDSANDSMNAISVNVSGQQLLTVRMPPYPVSTNSITTPSANGQLSTSSNSQAAMGSALPTSSNCVTATTVTLTTTTTTCALSLASESPSMPEIPLKQSLPTAPLASVQDSVGYSLSNILSQTIEDIPYLTTPPSTPAGPNGSHLENLLNTPSSIASKADFDAFISTSSNSNLLTMEELEIAAFQSPLKSTTQGLLAPPATFCESSILTTPTHINSSGSTNRLSDANISPIKLNLSAFLASPSHSQSPEKSLETLLQHQAPPIPPPSVPPDPAGHSSLQPPSSGQEQPLASVPTTQNAEETIIPQIHIPEECSDGLPLLDISMGGTISVKQQQGPSIVVSTVVDALQEVPTPPLLTTTCTGILSGLPGVSPIPNAGEISLAVTCVTTPASTVAVTGMSDNTSLSCGRVNVLEESLLNSFQESNDKMLDITLANSNSNSSFAGLLAAATHQPSLDTLMMENSLLQTPPRPMLSSTSGASVTASVKSNLSLDGEGFEGLSGTVPLSPPSSPSRLLRSTETQWMMNSESNEFSLSNLLGSIEASPHKGSVGSLLPPASPAPPSLPLHTSVPPLRSSIRNCLTNRPAAVDSSQEKMQNLISTLNDNSVDFTATFARLKSQTKDKLN